MHSRETAGFHSREYLVFVRAGPETIHASWILDDPERNWDCVVSWWGEPPDVVGEEYRCTGGAYKLDAFSDFYSNNLALVQKYKYVMIADDDLEFAAGDISRLFEICDRESLYLSQPALSWRGWVNHPITGAWPICRARSVSFVEMMVPIFSNTALCELIDSFLMTRSGCGVDWVWGYRILGRRTAHVIDAVTALHKRRVDPLRGTLYVNYRNAGIKPWDEYQEIVKRFPIPQGIRNLHSGHVYEWKVPKVLEPLLFNCLDIASKIRHRLHTILRD